MTDDAIFVPSGQAVTLIEALVDPDGAARFRFLAPAIAGEINHETASGDMAALCRDYALPRAQDAGMIVISLADRIFSFGETDMDAKQFFEVFTIAEGHCILEPY